MYTTRFILFSFFIVVINGRPPICQCGQSIHSISRCIIPCPCLTIMNCDSIDTTPSTTTVTIPTTTEPPLPPCQNNECIECEGLLDCVCPIESDCNCGSSPCQSSSSNCHSNCDCNCEKKEEKILVKIDHITGNSSVNVIFTSFIYLLLSIFV